MPRAATVATWNGHNVNSPANWKAGLRDLAEHGADIIGCQEASNDATHLEVAAYMRTLGFDKTRWNIAIPIYVRNTWEIVEQTNTVVCTGKGPGRELEAGTGTHMGYKSVTYVRLRHRVSGDEVYAINNHFLPSVEKGGELRWADAPKRMAWYLKQVEALQKIFKQCAETGRPTFAFGDYNVAWDRPAGRDLERRMAAVGAKCNWDALPDIDTHGTRIIDYVWYANCWAKSQDVLPKHNSDHSPVVVDCDPYLGPYEVDESAFSPPEPGEKNFLWSVRVGDGETVHQREPGFRITTGTRIVTVNGRKWLITEAGYRYALDYLKKV